MDAEFKLISDKKFKPDPEYARMNEYQEMAKAAAQLDTKAIDIEKYNDKLKNVYFKPKAESPAAPTWDFMQLKQSS